MTNGQTFRSRTSYALAAIVYFITLGSLASVVVAQDWANLGAATAAAILVCTSAHLMFWRPKVEIGEDGILLVNPLRTIRIGWQLVEDIDTRYALTVVVAGKKFSAWAATAPGRYHARSIHASELKGIDTVDGAIRPGDSPRTLSGAAAFVARQRLLAHRAAATGDQPIDIKLDVNWVGLGLLLASTVALSVFQYLH